MPDGNYLFDPQSTFLNGLFFGDDAGNWAVSPELRQIIATNQTRDAVRDLGKVQLASLYGQQQSVALQRESNQQLRDLNTGMEAVGSQMGQLSEGMDQLAGGMQAGFDQIGVGLQTGFQAVVKGLYHVDERLGQRMLVGFSSLGRQLQQQHRQTVGTLVQGFGFLSDAIDQAAGQTIAAIEQAAEAQIAATTKAARKITKAVIESGRLQTEAIVAMHRQTAQQLGEITDLLRHPDAVRAVEHFVVGMTFLNNTDVRRAQEQFRKAMEIYSGHFPTLFAYGFCCRVLNDLAAAENAFEAALSQAGTDPDTAARQRSLASLYLGRMAFDRRQYDQARRWFHQAFSQNERLWNALVEGAACLLVDQGRTNRQADALSVKNEFNQFGNAQFHRFGPDAYVLWYCLALTLAPLAPALALEAFRHGAHGDHRVRDQDRAGVIALLWRLNPRATGILLAIVNGEFAWLDAS